MKLLKKSNSKLDRTIEVLGGSDFKNNFMLFRIKKYKNIRLIMKKRFFYLFLIIFTYF